MAYVLVHDILTNITINRDENRWLSIWRMNFYKVAFNSSLQLNLCENINVNNPKTRICYVILGLNDSAVYEPQLLTFIIGYPSAYTIHIPTRIPIMWETNCMDNWKGKSGFVAMSKHLWNMGVFHCQFQREYIILRCSTSL